MASAPYWKLRRLAARAKRVLARRTGEAAAIAAYNNSLPSVADKYIAAFDTAAKYESTWKKEMTEGRNAVGRFRRTMRGWLPLVLRDVPGFDASDYGDKPGVPDDVIADGERLEAIVESYTDNDGKPLAYRDELLEAIDLERASREWSEAEAADSRYQKLLAEVRETGARFDIEIQVFGRTLRATVGTRDKDYQKLRSVRAATPDEDDDAAAPAPPSPLEPAPPGVAAPSRS